MISFRGYVLLGGVALGVLFWYLLTRFVFG